MMTGNKTTDNEDRKIGYVVVTAVSGKNLAPKDTNGFSDPYLKVSYGNDSNFICKETPYKRKTLTPNWDEKQIVYPIKKDNPEFPNVFVFDYKEKAIIKIECWDKDKMKGDDFMGQFQIVTREAFDKKEFFLKENVKTKPNTKKLNPKKKKKTFTHVSGTITISLSFVDKDGNLIFKETKQENLNNSGNQ